MTEETCGSIFAVALSAVLIVGLYPHPVHAQGEGAFDGSGLSPYWRPVVSRWEAIVVRYAEMRGLDPDLVASVIWKESRGIATVRGPTGAVGLMCVKPFPWRPDAEALENPWTNVAAGTATLAHVIRDGNGDVYYALAAYNGGWDQIHLRVTRRYAADVLDNYVRSVAVQHGLPADGDWIAVISVDGLPHHTTVTVLGPGRPVARYSQRPWSHDAVPSVPAGRAPDATLITFEGDGGRTARANLWLIEREPSSGGPAASDSSASPQVLVNSLQGLPD